jgi:hypothetical protein
VVEVVKDAEEGHRRPRDQQITPEGGIWWLELSRQTSVLCSPRN